MKKSSIMLNACSAVLACIVLAVTFRNAADVIGCGPFSADPQTSYETAFGAWAENVIVAVLAIVALWVVRTKDSGLGVKLILYGGMLGIIAFAGFGAAVTIAAYHCGFYGRMLFYAWLTGVSVFLMFFVTRFLIFYRFGSEENTLANPA